MVCMLVLSRLQATTARLCNPDWHGIAGAVEYAVCDA